MLLQNLGQSDGVCDFIDFIASPVVGLGDLLVQRRHPGSDKLAFLCAEFFFQQQRKSLCGIIEDIEVDAVFVTFGLGEDAVFALALGLNAHPMLRQAAKHIFALADVDKVVINADAVNARVFVFLSEALALQPCVNAVFVSHHQNTKPPFSALGMVSFFRSATGRLMYTIFSSGTLISSVISNPLIFVRGLVGISLLFISISCAG